MCMCTLKFLFHCLLSIVLYKFSSNTVDGYYRKYLRIYDFGPLLRDLLRLCVPIVHYFTSTVTRIKNLIIIEIYVYERFIKC